MEKLWYSQKATTEEWERTLFWQYKEYSETSHPDTGGKLPSQAGPHKFFKDASCEAGGKYINSLDHSLRFGVSWKFLFWWAKSNRLRGNSSLNLPTDQVAVHSCGCISTEDSAIRGLQRKPIYKKDLWYLPILAF